MFKTNFSETKWPKSIKLRLLSTANSASWYFISEVINKSKFNSIAFWITEAPEPPTIPTFDIFLFRLP